MTNVKPQPNDLIISTNEYRTVFVERVEADGSTLKQIATSSTFRRVRGLNTFQPGGEQRWCEAPSFTFPRIKKEGVGLVDSYLSQIGIEIPGAVFVRENSYLGTHYTKL